MEREIAYLTTFLDLPLTILVPTFRTTSCYARPSLRRRTGAPPLATSTCGVNQTLGSTHAEATAPHRGSRLSGTICPCQSVLPGRNSLKTKRICTAQCQICKRTMSVFDQILKEKWYFELIKTHLAVWIFCDIFIHFVFQGRPLHRGHRAWEDGSVECPRRLLEVLRQHLRQMLRGQARSGHV